MTAPGGRCYSAGDRIVTLAPGDDGRLVTSQHGVVTAVHPETQTFTARMDDHALHRFTREEMAKDRLALGYAVTVHRSQGDTVDVAHRLEDGGGRELAYVSMSRARLHTTVHVVADDLEQAREDLTRDWVDKRRPRWAIDSGTPATQPLDVERHPGVPAPMRAALRRARLEAERHAVLRAVPPDARPKLWQVNRELQAARDDRRDVEVGGGRYTHTDLGQAAQDLIRARHQAEEAERFAQDPVASRRTRRYWRHEAADWRAAETEAQRGYDDLAQAEIARLDDRIDELSQRSEELLAQAGERTSWLAQHPEADRRLRHLDRELHDLDRQAHPDTEFTRFIENALGHHQQPDCTPEHGHTPDHGVDLGMDLGL
jgi:ATP-dependent exoDNAse (exonuclease V), alpha subunit - helicase superfamily I member